MSLGRTVNERSGRRGNRHRSTRCISDPGPGSKSTKHCSDLCKCNDLFSQGYSSSNCCKSIFNFFYENLDSKNDVSYEFLKFRFLNSSRDKWKKIGWFWPLHCFLEKIYAFVVEMIDKIEIQLSNLWTFNFTGYHWY